MRCVLVIIFVAGLFCGSCSESKDSQITLTPEQQRLANACRMDSLTLQDILSQDSVYRDTLLDNLTAEAWLLVDDSTGCIISARNARKKMPIASLTKIMTGMLALEKGRMDDTIEIAKDVFVARDSRVRLGDRYRTDNMIWEMMLLSDNDAAYALAKHVGGDTLSFCRMMNERAAYLGMDSTLFANPNGVPNPNNYSTAYDLMRLARYAMQDSAFARIVGTAEKDIPLADGRHLPSQNTNLLLTSYNGCIGIKTGFTREAGHCLASAATRQGVTLYLILLNSRSMMSRFTESATLLDYGFRVMSHYRKEVDGEKGSK